VENAEAALMEILDAEPDVEGSINCFFNRYRSLMRPAGTISECQSPTTPRLRARTYLEEQTADDSGYVVAVGGGYTTQNSPVRRQPIG